MAIESFDLITKPETGRTSDSVNCLGQPGAIFKSARVRLRKSFTTAAAITAFILAAVNATSQVGPSIDNVSGIVSDVFVIKADEFSGKAKCDVFVAVPYQLITFHEYAEKYASQLEVHVSIRDSSGRRVADTTFGQTSVEDSYAVSRGSSGKSTRTVVSFLVKSGKYKCEIAVKDKFGNRDFNSSKAFDISNLGVTPQLSSLLYLSEVEQRSSRFSITPYIGDVIRSHVTSLFVFFEVYEDVLPQEVVAMWDISASDGRTLLRGSGDVVKLTQRTTRMFLPLNRITNPLPGSYVLTVRLHTVKNLVPDTTSTLASASKAYVIPGSQSGNIEQDINKAVRQLIYIASQDQIDEINAGLDLGERLKRFNDFWKSVDPTPSTVRNEAFEEYYQRIETAGRRYKSYTEGWLTDMGRVYIIYGEPINIERFSTQNNTVQNVRWTFSNNLAVTFEDGTGFGDFRLRTPLPPGSKYRYR